MIIVGGHLRVDAAERDHYLQTCGEVITLARAARGCLDFVIGADLSEPDRVNIYERWDSRDALDTFRGGGMSDDQGSMIRAMDVREFTCDSETRL